MYGCYLEQTHGYSKLYIYIKHLQHCKSGYMQPKNGLLLKLENLQDFSHLPGHEASWYIFYIFGKCILFFSHEFGTATIQTSATWSGWKVNPASWAAVFTPSLRVVQLHPGPSTLPTEVWDIPPIYPIPQLKVITKWLQRYIYNASTFEADFSWLQAFRFTLLKVLQNEYVSIRIVFFFTILSQTVMVHTTTVFVMGSWINFGPEPPCHR